MTVTYKKYIEDFRIIMTSHMLIVYNNRLPESIISDRGPQFVVELTKKLNRMLGVEIKLSILFHPQTDNQIEKIRIRPVFTVLC